MESHVDQAIPENSDQVMSSDEQSGTSQVAAKSYECTFCKRGFSNAQALGGHMNIHRKDKAKLKQASSNISETKQQQQQHQQRPLDIPKMPSSYSPILPITTYVEPNKPSDIERTRLRAWPWFLNKEGDDHHITTMRHDQNHVVQVQQLPLFSQTPSNQDHHHRHHQSPDRQLQVHGDQSEKGLQPSSHGSSGSGLDLELRLGPEPQDSSAAPNTTRKFF